MTVTVFTCRGIGEPLHGGQMLDHVTKHFPDDWRIVPVPWEAQYGPVGQAGVAGSSFDRSLTLGQHLLREMIDDAGPDPIVIIGYSGGAALAGHVADQLGPSQAEKVAAVGLLSDPFQPRGVSPHGFGIAGHRPVDWPVQRPGTVWSWSDADPICVTPELSPLRTIADQTAAMALGDPSAWGTDLINRLRRGRWQPSAIDWHDPLGTLRRYGDAIDAARRYLINHTADYPGTRTQELADRIIWRVNSWYRGRP